jgi:hypothetical protein
MGKEKKDKTEIPHAILTAEFEYLADAAQQANEDRARVTQYYFMALGSFIASLLGLKEVPDKYIELAYSGLMVLFLLYAGFGALTVEQLIRLRLAWLKCSLAMDDIKEHYIKKFPEAELASAIRFRTENLPPAFQKYSISHLLALATSVMSALSFLVAAVFLQRAWDKQLDFAGVIIAGAILAVALFALEQAHYYKKLSTAPIKSEIRQAIKKIESGESS